MQTQLLFFRTLMLVTLLCCAQASQLYGQESAPVIASFAPVSGSVGTEITISGSNFPTSVANTVVYVGGVKANVTSATSSQVKVPVPAGAASLAKISVTNTATNLTAYSTTAATPVFNVTFPGGVLDAGSYNRADYPVFGGAPFPLVIRDLNGNGKMDIATLGFILMRNEDNTGYEDEKYYPAPSGSSSGGSFLAVADLNGNGKKDLVVNDFNGNAVSVLLRNAANTDYVSPVSYPTGDFPVDVATGDFNNDGRTDIVTTNSTGISVLLRNTANTGFNSPQNYPVDGFGPTQIAVADFNNDGKADVAVVDRTNAGTVVAVLLRNTANTGFAAPVNYSIGSPVAGMTTGDFNGDGKMDLAFSSFGYNFTQGEYFSSVIVLLRNAANTGFNAPLNYPLSASATFPGYASDIVAGDFNGDGKADLAVAANRYNTEGNSEGVVAILLRTAANTGFEPRKDYLLPNTAQYLATGDLNGDGRADIAAASPAFLSVLVYNAPAKQDQVITFPPISDKKFSDKDMALIATASSGLPVSFRVVSGPATIAGNVLTFTGVGQVIVEAFQDGNGQYNPAAPKQQPFNILKGDQFISFSRPPDKQVTDPPFDLEASASSGLNVSFSISTNPASGVASLSGKTITLLGDTGTVTITASQAGNVNYDAAESVLQIFRVLLVPDGTVPVVTSLNPPNNATNVAVNVNPSLTFSEPVAQGTGNIIFYYNGVESSRISIPSASVSIDDNTVTIVHDAFPAGTTVAIQIDASAFKDQAGNAFAGITAGNWSFTTATEEPTDEYPPVIVSTNPADNATDQAPDVTVSVTYDEPVLRGSGNIQIIVNGVATILTPDAVAVNDNIVTLAHADFPASARVEVSLAAGAFTDQAANPTTAYSWNFTVVPAEEPVDTTGPVIIALSPANGALNVPPTTTLEFTFNEPVSKREGNIHITAGSQNQLIDIHGPQVALSADGRTVTVTPQTLPPDTAVLVRIEAYTFQDQSGNVFEGLNNWTFTTHSAEGPAVTSFTLINADTNEDIRPILEGDTINYLGLPTQNLSIRANTRGQIGSVVFFLNGRRMRPENIEPYAIAGDDPQGNYNPWALPVGNHTLTATPYAERNGRGTTGTALSVNFTVIGYVASFTLVNADTNEDIQPLTDGEVIDLSRLPTQQLSIRANTNPGKVGSVVFVLNGRRFRPENILPYAIAGDDPQGNYNPFTLPIGSHTLRATPYSFHSGRGVPGMPLTIQFRVISGNSVARLGSGREIIDGPGHLATFPNPFIEQAQVEFAVPQTSETTLDVYDTRGALVTRLYEGRAEAGKVYTVDLQAGSMQSGMYFIRLVSGAYAANGKVVLTR